MNLRKKVKKILYNDIPFVSGSFPYFGTKVYFQKDSELFLAACREGVFERNVLNLILNLVKDNTIYIDVGANIGLMSIPILEQKNPLKVLSFEPSPNTYFYLEKTFKQSKYNGSWIVSEKAVCNTIGSKSFIIGTKNFSAYDGLRDTSRVNCLKQKVTVQTTTLDYEWKLLNKPNVSCIKIDVEGAELDVLLGSRELINYCRPCFLLEWNLENLNAYECDIGNLIDFAKEFHYQVYSVPSFNIINDKRILSLFMIQGIENFLLLPNN